MCTVIIHVPETSGLPIRVLAVRDEDPERSWDPLGAWWPDTHPGVVGVRDSRAGGAWLAADDSRRRLAVILNRADIDARPQEELRSRGGIVLDAVEGLPVANDPRTHGFNLVEVTAAAARVSTWDGVAVRTTELSPGTHMIAHDEVDDTQTPRIVQWRAEFDQALDEDALDDEARESGAENDGAENDGSHQDGADAAASGAWWDSWLATLERSAQLDPTDDRAIVRDNRPYGYPTLSLLVCVASVSEDGVDVAYGELDRPGVWNRPTLA